MITLIGAIFIIPALYFFIRLQTTKLLYLFVASTPFIASTIVIKEGSDFGMQPAFFISLLFNFAMLIELAKKKYLISKKTLFAIRMLLIFGGWAIAAMAFPFVHRLIGNTSVKLFSPIILNGFAHEYHFQIVSQTIYLLLFIITVVLITIKADSIKKVKVIFKILVAGSVLSCLWAIGAQLIYNNILGYSYPGWIFNNNPGFFQGHSQPIWFGGKYLIRLCSFASEPSIFGYYLTMILALILPLNYEKIYILSPILQHGIALLIFVVMIMSTSSTALLGIGIIGILLTVSISFQIIKNPFRINRKNKYPIFFLVFCFVLFFIMVMLVIRKIGISFEGIIDIYDRVSISKTESGSFDERFMGLTIGFRNFIGTYFLGSGWGSNRLFELNFTILANLGIVGYFIFACIIYSSIKNAFIVDTFISIEDVFLFRSFGISLLSSVGLMSLSVPDLNNTYFWVVLAVLIAIPNIIKNEKTFEITFNCIK